MTNGLRNHPGNGDGWGKFVRVYLVIMVMMLTAAALCQTYGVCP